MPSETVNCRICQGTRPVVQNCCGGCGTPRANAQDNSKPQSDEWKPRCPQCSFNGCDKLEEGRYVCRRCLGVFEKPDMVFVDDRPDRNAEKRERQEQGSKRRRR